MPGTKCAGLKAAGPILAKQFPRLGFSMILPTAGKSIGVVSMRRAPYQIQTGCSACSTCSCATC
jgi:hypothetical protein